MFLIYLISVILFVLAIILFLGLTPEKVTNDIMLIASPKQSLDNECKAVKGKKKIRKAAQFLINTHNALVATGKGTAFTFICALSMILLITGGVISVIIGNYFLIPVLSLSLAILPFFYAKSTLNHYKKHVDEELETALSIITTSYVRSDDIVKSVGENVMYIKPPVKDFFATFVAETTTINSNTKSALRHLRERVDNQIYREWCDALIACQDDRTLKTSLMSVVNKLSDVRIVNNELKTMLYEPRKEYWTMVALIIGNIPLLFVLNRDWFHTLMWTLPGKIILAMAGAIITITAILMNKYCKNIEYEI